MNTKRSTTTTLVRTSVMIPADTHRELQELADARNEGKVAREIRAALKRYVEAERAAA